MQSSSPRRAPLITPGRCHHRGLTIIPIIANGSGGDQNPPRTRSKRFALRGLTREEQCFLQATLATARGIFRTTEVQYAD